MYCQQLTSLIARLTSRHLNTTKYFRLLLILLVTSRGLLKHVWYAALRWEGDKAKEQYQFILKASRKPGFEKNMAIFSTDGASNAKKQSRLQATEEPILLDILLDPSQKDVVDDHLNVTTENDVSSDDILCVFSTEDKCKQHREFNVGDDLSFELNDAPTDLNNIHLELRERSLLEMFFES